MKQTYFTSGEFARLCGTTKETLRHYHDIGLLVPARTAGNGYYYYAAFQFYDFYFISTFKGTNIPLKQLNEKLSGSDEKELYRILGEQLTEIEKKKEELLKKERLLRRTMDRFDTLYDTDNIEKLELYDTPEEYFIATPVEGDANSDKVWTETLRRHLSYCKEHHFDQEYQLTYMWNQADLMAKRDAAGWSICSQISAPADDPYFFVKPAGTYACILLRGYDFTASQSISVKKQIEALPLKICGNAYESDVSLFSSHAGRGYMTEISIQVERPPRS